MLRDALPNVWRAVTTWLFSMSKFIFPHELREGKGRDEKVRKVRSGQVR